MTPVRPAPSGLAVGDSLRTASPEERLALREQFESQHYVKLRGFFAGRLLDWITSELALAEFVTRETEGGTEWLMKPNALAARLDWLMNTPQLLQTVREITGAHDIGLFAGRVYRIDPSSGQLLPWHHDRLHERRLALSVNLTPRPYEGGVLKIRKTRAPDAVADVENEGLGDAVLFRVADGLEHCVTPVSGDVSRLAFAGWFRAGPDYYSALARFMAGAGEDPNTARVAGRQA